MLKKIGSLLMVCMMLCGIFAGCAENSTSEEGFTAWVDDSEPVAALKDKGYLDTVF